MTGRLGRPLGQVAGLILAAGRSSRMGAPKQLLPLHGRPILQHVVDAALAAGLSDLVVVVGHAAGEVARSLDLPPSARLVHNREHEAGQSTSLRAGLRALGPGVGGAVVLLGDQPHVRPHAIAAVVDAYRAGGARAVVCSYRDFRGHPVVLDRRLWREVGRLKGDRGAREILARHPEWVQVVEIRGDPPPDIDTLRDYALLLSAEDP